MASRALVNPPDHMHAFDSDWRYYVLDTGDLVESFISVGHPDEFDYERLWLRPVPSSAVDPSERPDGFESLDRDERGRFASTFLWFECREENPDAVAYYGVKYK